MARSDKRPVTVHTIAKHVGVSPSAVSTVLANRHEERRLAPATVDKIRQAVRELGYVPNIAARRLRAHDPEVHHREIGILTSFEAPLFLVSRVLRQVQRMADARTGPGRRFSVSIAMFHAGRLREMAGLLIFGLVSGPVVPGQWDVLSTDPDDPYGNIMTELKRQFATGVNAYPPYPVGSPSSPSRYQEPFYPTLDTYHTPLIISVGPDGVAVLSAL